MADKKNGENGSALMGLNKIAKGTCFKGEIMSDGDFRIDGRFEGTIVAKGRIVVGIDGSVEGQLLQCGSRRGAERQDTRDRCSVG